MGVSVGVGTGVDVAVGAGTGVDVAVSVGGAVPVGEDVRMAPDVAAGVTDGATGDGVTWDDAVGPGPASGTTLQATRAIGARQ